MKKQLEKILLRYGSDKINYLPLGKLRCNPYQARKKFDDRELLELSQSVKSYGVIQPIIVRPDGEYYQIIAGERRFKACQLLGLNEIPAIIKEMDDEKAAAISLIENLQRKELDYFEEANAYSLLINVFGITQEELARKIGKSQSAIANKLRLLRIPEEVRRHIKTDNISERHIRALLKLNNIKSQIDVIEQIYDKELTVKDTEELVLRISQNSIPRETNIGDSGQNVSMIIRDARIFINTIRETVRRARQAGVDINIEEKDGEIDYEIKIRIANKKRIQAVGR